MDAVRMSDPYSWGTGPADLVAASWERIPYTFVFDWFIQLGDWLASHRPTDNIFAQSYASYALDVKYFLDSPQWKNVDGTAAYVHFYLMKRIIDIEPPKLPLLDKRWAKITRSVDLIALTVGILKGVLTKRRR